MAVHISADVLFKTAIWTYDNVEFAFLVVLLFLIMLTLPSATFIQAFYLYFADHAKYDQVSLQFACLVGLLANGAGILRLFLDLHIHIPLHAGFADAVTTQWRNRLIHQFFAKVFKQSKLLVYFKLFIIK